MKKCLRCQVVKELTGFYRQKGTKTGYRNVCRLCQYTPKPKERTKEASIYRHIFRQYKNSASFRKLEFAISEEFLISIVKQKCSHCGQPPVKYAPFKTGAFVYKNGIDRINNKEGYTVSNCITACSVCNYSRQELSIEDWKAHCTKVIAYDR